MLQQKVRLRAATPHIQPKIQTVQGDTGRKLVCVIEDYEIPTGASASFWAVKPSGKGIQNTATISGQEITVTLTNQTLAERGWIACQLQITSGGQTVKTFKFCLDNKESLAGDWPLSENESTWINDKLDEMQKQIDQAIAQTQAATSAANEATQEAKDSAADANAAADEAREAVWNNKNLTNYTSAAESQVETAASAAVLTGIDGKTKQTTTTGAQLLDVRSKISSNSSGLTVSFSGDGELILNGTTADVNSPDIYFAGTWGATKPIATGTTALKVYGATSDEEIYLINGTTSVHYKGDSSITSEQQVTAVMIRMSKGKTYSNFRIKPMLNAGKTALPWEPYSGGIPAPNPDYPIPIQGVGGQTGDESFGFKAVVKTKNLIPIIQESFEAVEGLTASINRDGSIKITGKPTKKNARVYNSKVTLTPGKYYISGGSTEVGMVLAQVMLRRASGQEWHNNRSFEVKGDEIETVIYITYENATLSAVNIPSFKPMLNAGESALPFEPYFRSELSVTLPHPIFDGDKMMQVKAGQSYVDADGATQTVDRDLLGVYRQNRVLKFDGTEIWNENGVVEGATKKRYTTAINGDDLERVVDSDIVNGKSNMFAPASAYVGYEGQTECFSVQNDRFSYLNVYCGFQTVDEWKNHLKTSNMFAVLKAGVPYFEPFADQTPFLDWHTPEGGCTITTDDPLEPIISAYTAQTTEGSYLLTGYVDGLIGRNNQTLINALSNQVLALAQNSMEV